MQPKRIAEEASVNYEACKQWLRRNNGVHVVNEGNGWYRARGTLQLLKKLGFSPLHAHNVKVKIPATLKSLAGGLSPSASRLEGLGRVDAKDPNTRHSEWHGHALTVQGMRGGGHYVHLEASAAALAPEEFVEFSAWLQGLAYPETPMLDQVDFNVDVQDHRLKISGAQSVQLGDWTSAYVKAYNKDVLGVARIEACYHRLDAPFHEVARMLHDLASPPRLEEVGYRPELLPPAHDGEVV